MSFYDVYSAIPYALGVIGDRFQLEPALAAKRKAYYEQRSVPAVLCRFPWDKQLDPSLFVEPEDPVYLWEVVDMPEFRSRLGNILSKPGKYKCTVHPVEQDTKILYDGDIERNDALLFVEYAPWTKDDCLSSSRCIMNGDATDENHCFDKRGICAFCGSYVRGESSPLNC